MQQLRTFASQYRSLAALLLACALAMKALVPAGYMASPGAQLLSVSICADASGGAETRQIAIQMKGDPALSGGEHGKAAGPCAFSALAMASLAGADAPVLALALALAFVLAAGLIAATPPPASARLHLRPPLRGPPCKV
jgi:hypothetical protein